MSVNGTTLSVLQSAASEMGLPEFGSAAGNIQQIPQQLLSLYNLTGEMLVKRRVWRCLEREHSFDAIQDVSVYELPPDFARPISQTEWDRTNRWPMVGPETPQQWQWLKSGILSTGPRERFRLIGNTMEIWPVPGSDTVPLPVTISYFYISKWWVETCRRTAEEEGRPRRRHLRVRRPADDLRREASLLSGKRLRHHLRSRPTSRTTWTTRYRRTAARRSCRWRAA
jgi:hypothetical protein